MKKILIICLLLAPVFGAFAQEETPSKVLSPAEYQKEIQGEKIQLVDVRTPEEFEAGHVKGAVNIDFHREDFLDRMKELDKEETLYIYCRSGNRSGKAAVELSRAGFSKIVDLKGGYLAWEDFHKE